MKVFFGVTKLPYGQDGATVDELVEFSIGRREEEGLYLHTIGGNPPLVVLSTLGCKVPRANAIRS